MTAYNEPQRLGASERNVPQPPEPKIDTFEVLVKNRGEQWRADRAGLTPREARTRMIHLAGNMENAGWTAAGVDRRGITMASPEDDHVRMDIRIRKETS